MRRQIVSHWSKLGIILGVYFVFSSILLAAAPLVERVESNPGSNETGPLVYWQVDGFEEVKFPIHVIRVDLKSSGLKVVASAVAPTGNADSDKALTRLPKAAARDAGMIAAINANAFMEDAGALSRITGVAPGKAVELLGEAVAQGVFFPGRFDPYGASLWCDSSNAIHIGELPEGALAAKPGVTDAVSGFHQLIRDGELLNWGAKEEDDAQRIARTAAGVSRNGNFLYLVVAEGKHGVFSKSGFTEPAIARFMMNLGCSDALMLDCGGSSSMVADFGDGLKLLNRPADRLPRPVPVMLGIVVEEGRSEK